MARFRGMTDRFPFRVAIGAWAAYAALFPVGHMLPLDDMFAATALAPALVTAHLFGLRGALWVGAGFLPLQALLFLAGGHDAGWEMFAGVDGLFGLIAIPIVGVVAARATEMNRRLEGLHGERDRFIAQVAHDVKTPLTGVIGLSLALTENTDLNDEARELAQLIAEEAQAASDVVEDLSVTALRNSGVFQVHPESFQVVEEVVVAASRFEGVVLDVEPDVAVWADRRRLRQILNNLLTNAQRHGNPPIEIQIHRQQRTAMVDVTDAGPGIAPDHIESLFEPFGMVGVSGHVESTGLGLSSSLVLATSMGGTLEYRREQGKTMFRLSLPTSHADHEPGEITTSEATT